MRKIKIAQIGTSRYGHGRLIFEALAANPDVFEIVGYALPENEREKFPKSMEIFEGYREMTVEEILGDPEIEAVAIETEEIYLTKYAQMAVEAGKHVHMEKPGAPSLADYERLIATAKAGGKVFHTGYMYRYNPVIMDFMERIKQGEIGEIVSVEAQMNCWHKEECMRWLSVFEGGMMFYLGCHMVDLVLLLQGLPQRIVSCNKCSGRFDGVDSKDNSFAMLEYERGASFVKISASEHGGYLRRQLVITGTKGRFEICPLEVQLGGGLQYTEYSETSVTSWHEPVERKRSEPHNRYAPMMIAFAEMVQGERENPYTYDYELTLFRVLLECCK